jgi:quercetin dioxygenase-like cupin family protein
MVSDRRDGTVGRMSSVMTMHRWAIAGLGMWLAASTALAQDPMQYGVKHLKILTEDQKVRVLRYSPKRGDKTPMHSHPATIVYVVHGGRVRYTMPDGSIQVSELKTGAALIRPPVTHADEALSDVEAILVELKQ